MPIVKNNTQAYLCDVASIVKRKQTSPCFNENIPVSLDVSMCHSEISSIDAEKVSRDMMNRQESERFGDEATSSMSSFSSTIPNMPFRKKHSTGQADSSLVLSASQTLSLQSTFEEMQKQIASLKEEKQSAIKERDALQQEVIQLKCELAASKGLNDHYLLQLRQQKSSQNCDETIALDDSEHNESGRSLLRLNSVELLTDLVEVDEDNAEEKPAPALGRRFSLSHINSFPRRESGSSAKSAASMPIMKPVGFFRRNVQDDAPNDVLINADTSQDTTPKQARFFGRRASMDNGCRNAAPSQAPTKVRRATVTSMEDAAAGQMPTRLRKATMDMLTRGEASAQPFNGIGKLFHRNHEREFAHP